MRYGFMNATLSVLPARSCAQPPSARSSLIARPGLRSGAIRGASPGWMSGMTPSHTVDPTDGQEGNWRKLASRLTASGHFSIQRAADPRFNQTDHGPRRLYLRTWHYTRRHKQATGVRQQTTSDKQPFQQPRCEAQRMNPAFANCSRAQSVNLLRTLLLSQAHRSAAW